MFNHFATFKGLLFSESGLEKKVLSGHMGQVDFPGRQVTFHPHLPDGQWPKQVVCQVITFKKVN